MPRDRSLRNWIRRPVTVAGGAVALVAPVLAVVGVVSPVVAAAVAGAALIAGPGVAAARGSEDEPVAEAPPEPDLPAQLDHVEDLVAGKVPPAVEARVRRITGTLRETLPRLGQLGRGSSMAHSAVQTATSYLPEAVGAYLRLPRSFADRRPVSGGKTPLLILCDQLDLLASEMDEVFDAVCRADADALVAHGRFLAEKFGAGSALDIGTGSTGTAQFGSGGA